MKNIFDPTVTAQLIDRVNQLKPESPALWGKMAVDQMLAHCCVTYEMTFTNKHPKPNIVVRFLLKTFVKKGVINEVPYKKTFRLLRRLSSGTAKTSRRKNPDSSDTLSTPWL